MSAVTTDRNSPITGEIVSQRDTGAFTGIFQLTADTHHGAPGPLAAPLDCDGPAEYLGAIRWRYQNSPAVRQQIAVIAHRMAHQSADPVPVLGPYAQQAREILARIAGGSA